jgi:7-keto-8-aminopelargonate synthetase-like enzyme
LVVRRWEKRGERKKKKKKKKIHDNINHSKHTYTQTHTQTKPPKQFAEHVGTERAILYSFGHATAASAIPAWASRGDTIVCDESLCAAAWSGVRLSRARVVPYKAGDLGDLERVLASLAGGSSGDRSGAAGKSAGDAKGGSSSTSSSKSSSKSSSSSGSGTGSDGVSSAGGGGATSSSASPSSVMTSARAPSRGGPSGRRWIVCEAIAANTGAVLDLPRLIELKARYGYRVCVDESLTLGVLGEHGRGLTEHFAVPVSSVDMITCALSGVFGTMGGVVLGNEKIVEHQRLSGSGYCFSASLPAYLSAAAEETLDMLIEDPKMAAAVRANGKKARAAVAAAGAELGAAGFEILSATPPDSRPLHGLGAATRQATAPRAAAADPAHARAFTEAAASSPVIHLVPSGAEDDRAAAEARCVALADAVEAAAGVLVEATRWADDDAYAPRPSVRIVTSRLHTAADFDKLTEGLKKAAQGVAKK